MISRRSLASVLAGVPFLGIAKPAVAATPDDAITPVTWVEAESLADLAEKLKALPNQCEGSPTSVCSETGEKYIAILERGLARPGDEKLIERMVAERMAGRITTAMEGRTGRIYWREPLEYDIGKVAVVDRYDENGPNVDFVTNRRCYLDSNWIKVSAYVRFIRAKV